MTARQGEKALDFEVKRKRGKKPKKKKGVPLQISDNRVRKSLTCSVPHHALARSQWKQHSCWRALRPFSLAFPHSHSTLEKRILNSVTLRRSPPLWSPLVADRRGGQPHLGRREHAQELFNSLVSLMNDSVVTKWTHLHVFLDSSSLVSFVISSARSHIPPLFESFGNSNSNSAGGQVVSAPTPLFPCMMPFPIPINNTIEWQIVSQSRLMLQQSFSKCSSSF